MNVADDRWLLDTIARAARQMPPGRVASFAAVVGAAPGYSQTCAGRALGAVANPAYRRNAQSILTTWAATPDLPGVAVALALRTAALTHDEARSEQSVEIVWTGPSSHEAPVRKSFEALLELIRMARTRLTIVSFAAYRVPEVLHALAEAADRGADVRLVLESAEEAEGRLSHDAANAFGSLGGSVAFYVWPKDRRTFLGGDSGLLHAKAIIADDRAALVTSANLTGKALTSNMELGLLVRGGTVAARLNRHFDELTSMGILLKIREHR